MTEQAKYSARLKSKLKALDRLHDEGFYIRLHRAISWLKQLLKRTTTVKTYKSSLVDFFKLSMPSRDVDRLAKVVSSQEFFEKVIEADKPAPYMSSFGQNSLEYLVFYSTTHTFISVILLALSKRPSFKLEGRIRKG